MSKERKSIYVGVDEICDDWGVSRSRGYVIIKELSEQLKKEMPNALVMSGKINRRYYEEVCLKN